MRRRASREGGGHGGPRAASPDPAHDRRSDADSGAAAFRDPFEALADPTRRAILRFLADAGEQPAGAIAAQFPWITRPAVSRHLRILRESTLVTAARVGKQQRYALNAAALNRLHREWFASFAPLWEEALQNLKRSVDAG